MQVIFETQDIAKATSDNMVTLMGLMQSIAKRVMDEPAEQKVAPKAEPVKEPEPAKEPEEEEGQKIHVITDDDQTKTAGTETDAVSES